MSIHKHALLAGILAQPDRLDEVTELDGVRIVSGKYALNDDGKIASPSSQNMAQLKAELLARGLSAEGKRDELKRRVMVSHSALSLPVSCMGAQATVGC